MANDAVKTEAVKTDAVKTDAVKADASKPDAVKPRSSADLGSRLSGNGKSRLSFFSISLYVCLHVFSHGTISMLIFPLCNL